MKTINLYVPLGVFRYKRPLSSKKWGFCPGFIFTDKEEAEKSLQRMIGRAEALGAVECFTDIMTITFDPENPEKGRTSNEES